MKVKLRPVNNFGRKEFKPANELGDIIAQWLEKKNLSDRDKEFMKMIGFEVVVFEYAEVKA